MNTRIFNNKKIILCLIVFIFYVDNSLCQNYSRAVNEECKVNLHCNSACCKSNKCSETKECLANNIYIYQVIASAGLVIIFSIYLFIKLKCIKDGLEDKKKKN